MPHDFTHHGENLQSYSKFLSSNVEHSDIIQQVVAMVLKCYSFSSQADVQTENIPPSSEEPVKIQFDL